MAECSDDQAAGATQIFVKESMTFFLITGNVNIIFPFLNVSVAAAGSAHPRSAPFHS